MEYMLDTVCLESIEKYLDIVPIKGVTSTPSIIKREGKIDFFSHMKRTLDVIGSDRTLHMQVVAKDTVGMMADAKKIWRFLGEDVFVKIPASKAGLSALTRLKKDNAECRITTSAVYTKLHAFMALEAGADYVAIYTNRSEALGIDPFETIHSAKRYATSQSMQGKIMASSIKSTTQITDAIEAGADAVTFSPTILEEFFHFAATKKAIDDFTDDWISLYQTKMI
ncbi:MAG: fructose-6-phosphate aldolase [Enterococcus gilvus]